MTEPASEPPLVSFILLAYNQEKYIRAAIEGAFSQTYSPLEIILSDDCSTDRTFEIMKEMANAYKGPHKVILNQNKKNLGIGGNYNSAASNAKGEVFLLAAGDDISLPFRTERTIDFLSKNSDVTCCSMELIRFEETPPAISYSKQSQGVVTYWKIDDYLKESGLFVNAPARAIKSSVHNVFGPLSGDCPVEDGSLLFRSLLLGTVATLPGVGVLYRWNGENISSPDKIKNIKKSLIVRDYIATLKIAKKLDLVKLEKYRELEEHMEKRMEIELLYEKIRFDQLSIYIIYDILKSGRFSVFQKAKLISKVLLKWAGIHKWTP